MIRGKKKKTSITVKYIILLSQYNVACIFRSWLSDLEINSVRFDDRIDSYNYWYLLKLKFSLYISIYMYMYMYKYGIV